VARRSEPEPAKIGPLDGIQVGRIVRQRAFGRIYIQEQVLRLACSPRGDIIRVEYVPLTGLTDPQLELLNAICAAVRLDDPAFTTTPEEWLQHAGLQLPQPEDWRVIGPDFSEVPGLYVQGSANGTPAWSLGVFRTWLTQDRTARDLLASFASESWQPGDVDIQIAESQREDGATVFAMRHPAIGQTEHNVAAVWAVAESAERVALIFVYSGAGFAEAAEQAAARLAQGLTFGPTAALPPLADADAAGRELAAMLTRQGGVPWWGGRPQETCYLGPQAAISQGVYVQRAPARAPVGADPAVGYYGHTLCLQGDGERPQRESWVLDARAHGYTYEYEGSLESWQGSVPAVIEEVLAANSVTVTRTMRTPGGSRSWQFDVGPAFVRPPTESVAEAWVAQRDEGAWLIEATSHREADTHSRLLRPLPPDEAGRRRLLLLMDYNPRGVILGFDDDREPLYQLHPGGDYQRATLKTALRHFPGLRRWREELREWRLEPPD
jgi:hypothetical protein